MLEPSAAASFTLDQQLDLLNLWTSPEGARWVAYFEGQARKADIPVMRSAAISSLRRSIPYWVTEEMGDLIVAGLETMPRDIPLYNLGEVPPLPSDQGFVLLENGLWAEMPPSPGSDDPPGLYYRAFTWSRKGPKVLIWLYEWIDSSLWNKLGISYKRSGLWPVMLLEIEEHDTLNSLEKLCGVSWNPLLSEAVLNHQQYWMAWLFSFFALIQQRLIQLIKHHASRTAARRWNKQLTEDPKPIQIVTLRAMDYIPKQANGDPVDWAWRWIVRGHWRRQWYPASSSHRPIWVSRYVKGPPDRPLKPAKIIIYELRR